MGVACDERLEAAAVDELNLGDVGCCRTGDMVVVLHVDVGAVAGVVLVVLAVEDVVACVEGCIAVVFTRLADGSLLSAAENLEGVAGSEVDRSTAPHLGVGTIAAAEDVEGQAQGVHTLLVEDDAGIAFRNGVFVVIVEKRVCLGHNVEDSIISRQINDIIHDVDNHVTVHVSALVTASVDVTATETTVELVLIPSIVPVDGPVDVGRINLAIMTICITEGVPFQSLRRVGVVHPSLRLYLQTGEVEDETVLDAVVDGVLHAAGGLFSFRTDHTTEVSGIVLGCIDVGIVASAHELVVDDDLLVEVDGVGAGPCHAASVAAAVEGAYLAGVVDIVGGVAVLCVLEDDAGVDGHGTTLHVLGKARCVRQVHRTVFFIVGSTCIFDCTCSHIYVFGILVQDVLGHHVGAVIAQEHLVDDGVGAYLQFHFRVYASRERGVLCLQAGAVAAEIDGTLDDGGMSGIGSLDEDGDLFGVGAEDVQRLNGLVGRVQRESIVAAVQPFLFLYFIGVVVEVGIAWNCSQGGVVGVGVGAVAAAIDVAIDRGVDTHGVAAEDAARNVVTAIDVGDFSATDDGTCWQAGRELIAQLCGELDGGSSWIGDAVGVGGSHVGSSAAAIDVDDGQVVAVGRCRHDVEYESLGVRHVAFVAAGIDVTKLAPLQVPDGTYLHLGLVVAAKHTRRRIVEARVVALEGGDAREGRQGIQHVQERCSIGFRSAVYTRVVGRNQRLQALTGVVHADGGVRRHRSVVAAAIDLRQTAAVDFEIGLGEHGQGEGFAAMRYDGACGLVAHFVFRGDDVVVPRVFTGHVAGRIVVVLAVAAAIDTTDEDTTAIGGRIQILCTSGACADAGAPGIVDGILGGMRLLCLAALEDVGQFCRKLVHSGVAGAERLTDGAGDVVAAIDRCDDYHARTMFAVEVDECPTADVGHTGTTEDILDLAGADGHVGVASCVAFVAAAIDVAAYAYLGMKEWRCKHEKQERKEEVLRRVERRPMLRGA